MSKSKTLKKAQIAKISLLAMFSAIIFAMTFTPYIGYITIPGMLSITTIHIIVIIGVISTNTYISGAILGTVWGVSCLLYAISNGTADAAIFLNPMISVIPRILVGIATVAFYRLAVKSTKNKVFTVTLKSLTNLAIATLAGLLCHNISESLAISIIVAVIVFIFFAFLFYSNKTKETMPILFAAICGTFTNTVLVLFAINLFGGSGIIDLVGTLKNIYLTVVALNGSIEVVAASIIAVPCCVAIKHFIKKFN